MNDKKPPTTIEGTFRAMRKLLSDPQRWTKGSLARHRQGARWSVPVDSPQATCFCLLGADNKVQPDPSLRDRTQLAMEQSLGLWFRPGAAIPQFNDARMTKHEDILEFLDVNIQLAKMAGV